MSTTAPVAAAHPLRALPPHRRTVQHLLSEAVRAFPERELIRAPEGATYADVARRVAAAGEFLERLGVAAGDRVVVVAENRVETLELFLACCVTGALFVPINPHLRGEQLVHQLRDAEGAIAVVEEAHEARVREALEGAGAQSRVLVLGEGRWELDGGAAPPPAGRRDATLTARDRPGDPVAVLYTSGTTGPSKGVLCPSGQFYWWVVTTGEALGHRDGDVLYTCLPLYHVNALSTFLQAAGVGGAYCLDRRFSASRFTRRLGETGATVTYLLGAMVTILTKQEPSDHDRAHDVRVALAPATPPEIVDEVTRRFGMGLVDGFGMTELNMVCAGVPDDADRAGPMGRVMADFEAHVVDDDDVPVPDGEPGELVVRPRQPHSVALGYWRRPEATVEAWRNLWFHTGDRVVRELDGSFRYLDRMKDMIRRRGENVSSFEVEAVLNAHPAVAEAACIGVRSELGEDEVMAVLIPRPGADVAVPELLEWASERLAYFAVPRYVDVVEDLPRTPNGKVRKTALRERGVTESTFDREREGIEIRRG